MENIDIEESLNNLTHEELEAEVDKIFNNHIDDEDDNNINYDNEGNENDNTINEEKVCDEDNNLQLKVKIENNDNDNDNHKSDVENDNDLEEESQLKKEKKNQEDKEKKIKQIEEKEKLEEIEDLDLNVKKFTEKELEKKNQLELLLRIFRILNYDVETIKEITEITLYRDKLIDKNTRKIVLELIPDLKEEYKSAYLTCLHDNSIYKQKYPVINLLRQILKCNHLILKPKIVSNGYEKITGKKKVMRMFTIEKAVY